MINLKDKALLRKLKEIREWAERVQENMPESSSTSLQNMCAPTSILIYQYLKDKANDIKIYDNRRHSFVVADGWIIDVTATQFNEDFPKILIHELENKNVLHRKTFGYPYSSKTAFNDETLMDKWKGLDGQLRIAILAAKETSLTKKEKEEFKELAKIRPYAKAFMERNNF